MPDTTSTAVELWSLKLGDTLRFNGQDYVLVEHKRSRSSIATIGDGKIKIYNLAMRAKVEPTGHDDVAFRLALVALHPPVTVKAGDNVRFLDTPRSRSRNLAGKEAIVVSVNAKTISLSNGWRVSPEMVEAI